MVTAGSRRKKENPRRKEPTERRGRREANTPSLLYGGSDEAILWRIASQTRLNANGTFRLLEQLYGAAFETVTL